MTTPRYLTRNFGNPDALSYDGYVKNGGYAGLKKALGMKPLDIVEEVKKGNLRGRGGAGFPAGVKWGFIPKDYVGPKYLAVNADEGEPGTFKDRPLMEQDPHQLLEGIAITCFALGITTAYIYIRGEFFKATRAVSEAVAQLYEKGMLGKDLLGSGFTLDIHVHNGAGAYICGEERAMIESLEGKKGFPRLRPPFPAVKGLFGKPTIINNVETLACLPHIVSMGGEAWAALGCEKNGGTKMYCVSGQVAKPGLFELPHSVTLRELVFEHAGGPLPGRKIKAIIPGGSSSKILTVDECDVRMDVDSLAKAGTMLGSAAVMVLDDSACMVRVLENLAYFYSHESCGQCTPCREGTFWMHKILKNIVEGRGTIADLDRLADICDNMAGQTICALADAAVFPVQSFTKKFRKEFEDYIQGGKKISLLGWKEEAKSLVSEGAH